MERTLELVDTSAKNEADDDGSNNGEASVYSSHFLMDFLPPTKKGQRECLPLLIKVHCTALHYIDWFRVRFSSLSYEEENQLALMFTNTV